MMSFPKNVCVWPWLMVLATLAALTLGVPAVAQEALDRVGSGDTLLITIYGEDRLTGRYRVGPDGAISFPLLGRIRVSNRSIYEIGQDIANGLSERVALNGEPLVDIAEFAQVYVTGEVEKPGHYEFRPGMIALELVTLGGGLRRNVEPDSAILQIAMHEQEVMDLKLQQFALQLQRARLKAEIEGSSFNPVVAARDDYPTRDTRAQSIANERAIFDTHVMMFANQANSLREQRKGYDTEIASLEESIALHDSEIKLLVQDLATQETLVARGLAVQQKVSDLRRTVSATRRVALDFRLALARAHQRQLEIDQRLVELRESRANELNRDLREVDLTLERTDKRIGTLLAALAETRINLRESRSTRLRAPTYMLIRNENGRRTETVIDEYAEIRPRDIVRVERSQPATNSPEFAIR